MDVGKGQTSWFVAAGTSRYFFNYRHSADAFAFHKALRGLNVSERRIITWDGADVVGSPLNPTRGDVFIDPSSWESALGDDMIVQHRGDSVSLTVMKDTLLLKETSFQSMYGELTPVLPTGTDSKLVMFWSGHGGDEFFKFHDQEELDAVEMARVIMQMHLEKKFDKLLLLIDTCQAATMAKYFDELPNTFFVASSLLGENSYALQTHEGVGLSVVDRFSHQLHSLLLEKWKRPKLLSSLTSLFPYERLFSHVYLWHPSQNVSKNDMDIDKWFSSTPSEVPRSSSRCWETWRPSIITATSVPLEARQFRRAVISSPPVPPKLITNMNLTKDQFSVEFLWLLFCCAVWCILNVRHVLSLAKS